MRARAAGLVTAELGYRSERDIDLSLKRDVEAERWTSLDHRLQSIAVNNGGMIDLRSDPNHNGSSFDKHLAGRAMKLRSEEHTSELQSLMRNSYAVFCLKKKTTHRLTRATQTK